LDRLRCIAIDDEPLALEVLQAHAAQLPFIEISDVFTSPLKAMTVLQSQNIDLVFLDIHMPELNGLRLPKLVNTSAEFVFVTAYKEHAYESYELRAVDYLLKPVSFDRFLMAVNKVLKVKKEHTVEAEIPTARSRTTRQLFVRADKKIVQLNITEILYIEGLKDYVTIYLPHRKVVARESLKKIATLLSDAGFVRIHRSYIVPFSNIQQLEGNSLLLQNVELPIGVSYKKALLTMIDEHLIGDRQRLMNGDR
jgi:two-component system LytT family response regulator